MNTKKPLRKKILLSAGGTGGHLFPAQVVAKQLRDQFDILFVGGKLSQNPFFDREGFPFQEIPAAPLTKKIGKGGIEILKGIKKSRQILKEFNPDLVIGFGSFYTFPLLFGALTLKVPIMLHEQNAVPGRVTRLFSRFAKTTAISFPKSEALLKGNIEQVLFPIRNDKDETDSFAYYGFERDQEVLLIFGGSQGAKKLNYHFMEMVSALPKTLQILHFTGDKTISEEASLLYKRMGFKYCVKEFEKNMIHALTVANCVISRAGASTCFELIEWEKPALLIPFPEAKDNHQYHNALHFVDEAKGGFLLLQDKITPLIFREMVMTLFDLKEEKKNNLKNFKKKNSFKHFSEVIAEYLEPKNE